MDLQAAATNPLQAGQRCTAPPGTGGGSQAIETGLLQAWQGLRRNRAGDRGGGGAAQVGGAVGQVKSSDPHGRQGVLSRAPDLYRPRPGRPIKIVPRRSAPSPGFSAILAPQLSTHTHPRPKPTRCRTEARETVSRLHADENSSPGAIARCSTTGAPEVLRRTRRARQQIYPPRLPPLRARWCWRSRSRRSCWSWCNCSSDGCGPRSRVSE